MEAEAPVNQPAISQPVVSQPVVNQPAVNQPAVNQPAVNQPIPKKNGPNQKKNRKKNPQHSADIVYSKGASIQTMPSLGKLLKGVTECVIGLQYVWEYRSPSKSVQPHYQCKLCAVARLQHDMLAHVKGWKHSFRYLKKVHPDKVTQEEEDAVKDPSVRKAIKEAAAEVEKTEGRGQLKVILKEPCEVLAFNGLRSAIPKPIPPGAAPAMGLKGPPFGLSGPRFSDMRYQGEYSSHGGHHSDYPGGDYGDPGYGGFDYSSRQDSYGSDMDRRPYPAGGGDDYGSGGGRTGHNDDSGHMHPDEYQGGQMGSSLMDKPPGLMGAAPDSSNLSNTLLTYLDTFRIENENDAQLVLKVTQKLTDVLMEYRLRSVSAGGPSLSSFSMGSTGFSTSSSRSFSSASDRFSSGQSGPSRYSDGPSRYYK